MPTHARIQKKFFQKGPTLTTLFLVDGGKDEPNNTKSGLLSARQRNTI